jgi:uncharacterized protein (DUF1778 family)
MFKRGNDLTDHSMGKDMEQQATARRDEVVGGSVTPEERALIEAARQKAGIRFMSEFVRETMLHRAKHILTPKRAEDRAA